MKITLLTVGKIKEACFRDAAAEYKKRLSRFCELNVIEVPDEPAPERASEAQCRQIKEREGERLLKASNPKAYHIVLAVEGKKPVHFFGRTGGIVPTVREIITQVEELAKGGK